MFILYQIELQAPLIALSEIKYNFFAKILRYSDAMETLKSKKVSTVFHSPSKTHTSSEKNEDSSNKPFGNFL